MKDLLAVAQRISLFISNRRTAARLLEQEFMSLIMRFPLLPRHRLRRCITFASPSMKHSNGDRNQTLIRRDNAGAMPQRQWNLFQT